MGLCNSKRLQKQQMVSDKGAKLTKHIKRAASLAWAILILVLCMLLQGLRSLWRAKRSDQSAYSLRVPIASGWHIDHSGDTSNRSADRRRIWNLDSWLRMKVLILRFQKSFLSYLQLLRHFLWRYVFKFSPWMEFLWQRETTRVRWSFCVGTSYLAIFI